MRPPKPDDEPIISQFIAVVSGLYPSSAPRHLKTRDEQYAFDLGLPDRACRPVSFEGDLIEDSINDCGRMRELKTAIQMAVKRNCQERNCPD
jgi:hypothetical protein